MAKTNTKRKGKNYEEIYGKERAKKIKEKLKESQNKVDRNCKNNPFFGKKHSEESRKRMSQSLKGRTVWNKGTKGLLKSNKKGRTFEDIYGNKAKSMKENISLKLKGRSIDESIRKIISNTLKGKKPWNTGKHLSEEHKRKIGNSQLGKKRIKMSGSNHPNWKGGVSFEPYLPEFNNILKEKIRSRDNYRCQQCFRHQNELFIKRKNKKIVRSKLSIHHIDYNKKNNDSNNLISLCPICHTQTNFKREDWINYFRGKLNGK